MTTTLPTLLGSLFVAGLATVLVACGGETADPPMRPESPAITFELDQLPAIPEENVLLPGQLGDFEPVAGETYALRGRIKDRNSGLHVLVLVDDTQVAYNPERPEPWTYCCASPELVRENSLVVRFVREGETMPERITPQAKPAHRLLDLITAVGTLHRNEQGTLVFLATGYVLDERPELGSHVQWPAS